MFQITYKQKEVKVENENQVIEYIQQIISNGEIEEVFCKIEGEEFALEIWIMNQKKQCVLLYIPKDEREDYKISCCGDITKIDAPRVTIKIEEARIDCSEYCIIDIQTGLQCIEKALHKEELTFESKWICY